MWRCAQLLCVRCLLYKVKVLRFNYQKMFAVGSVPVEDCQGQGCGCPPYTWAGGHPHLPRETMSGGLGMAVLQGRGTSVRWAAYRCATVFSSHSGGEHWILLCRPIISFVLALARMWWCCCGLIHGSGLAGDYLPFRKTFYTVTSLKHVTWTLEKWERCRAVRVLHL